MADSDAEVIALQLAAVNAPLPQRTTTATNLLIPDASLDQRLAHFPEEVYDLRESSHLRRFMSVLLGDSGVGQARKRMMLARLQQVIQGVHFYDLDRFYGALFGVRRTVDEMLAVDPYTQTATSDVWDQVHAKDASYRSRITQFARAITFGATPTGMELVAEALLSVDCDVYESFTQADSAYQTVGEVEARYATLADMEGVSIGVLEGAGLTQLAGDNRRQFVIRPKRQITSSEAYELTRVLDRLKPADARFTIDTAGAASYVATPIGAAIADSNYWEVGSAVIPATAYADAYQVVPTPVVPPTTPDGTAAPLPQVVAVEQPRPPFTSSQNRRWSYATDIVGISAYSTTQVDVTAGMASYPQPLVPAPEQRVMTSAGLMAHPPRFSLASVYLREMINARVVAHPSWASRPYNFPDLAPLYADGIALDRLRAVLDSDAAPTFAQQASNAETRYWMSTPRLASDLTTEVVEFRFGDEKLINSITFDMAAYPQTLQVLWGSLDGAWHLMSTETLRPSAAAVVDAAPTGDISWTAQTPPWVHKQMAFDAPVLTSRLRIQATRLPDSPVMQRLPGGILQQVAYPVALRALDVGFAVRDLTDVPTTDGPIATTKDVLGSHVEFSLRTERLADLVAGQATQWRSEPQPVNYAVVNCYLDVRDAISGPTVIDRFYLEPTTSGPHLTLYYTNDAGGDASLDWYEAATWTPIPRDYTLQKGYLQIPPTAARHFKFEFTSLSAEPYDSVVPITRTVRLFPAAVAAKVTLGTGAMSNPPVGVVATQDVATPAYSDVENVLRNTVVRDGYAPTEAVHATDPTAAEALQRASWAYALQPWHQGGPAPRFDLTGQHTYDIVRVAHLNKVAFSVGLLTLRAYRQDFGADDDTQVYLEQFHDFRHITPGFTWTFNPNAMTTELASNAVATSTVLSSRHRVKAIQFATQQTPAIQLVPDDDFRDPANAASTWSSPDGWQRVGDAILAYQPGTHSVRIQRYAQARPLTPSRAQGHLTDRDIHPVFSTRDPTPITPAPAPAVQVGGIVTPLLGVASDGQVHVAYRLTIEQITQPFYVEILSGSTVVASQAIFGAAGTTIENFLSYRLRGEATLTARVVQYGPSNDLINLDTLSVFDEGIVWDFSVNGGNDWVTAYDVRNNANGIITFPDPGNQLVWRARGLRPRMAISAVKIRPQYVGVQDARYNGAQRGPNVSTYDQDVPVQDDPMFTDWHSPIPKGWWSAFKRFPTLAIESGANVTEFARFYGRPIGDTVAAPTDDVEREVLFIRDGAERMDFFQPVSDGVSRAGSVYHRTGSDTADGLTDDASPLKVPQNPGKPFNRVVHPT